MNAVTNAVKNINLKPTNKTEISKFIQNLKNFNSGTDGISNKLIKSTNSAIIAPLVFIINLVLLIGTVPLKLKECIVKPMSKKNSKTNPGNYRPLTITSSFSKLLERVILYGVEPFWRINYLISDKQCGCKRGTTTIDAVTAAVDSIATAKCGQEIVVTIFLDLSKAVDCVDYSVLLPIVYKMGIRGTAHKLIKSFLTKKGNSVSK